MRTEVRGSAVRSSLIFFPFGATGLLVDSALFVWSVIDFAG